MSEKILKSIIIISLIFLCFFFIFFNLWIQRYFGNVDFDLILVNINFGFQGLIDADDYVVNKFIEYCLYAPTIICLIIFLIQYKILKKNIFNYKTILINFIISFSVIVFSLEKINFFENIIIKDDNYFLKNNYVKIDLNKSFDIEKKKDLVIIYLESFEENYLENPAFNNEIMKKLNFNNLSGTKIPKLIETKYNNFTIGGIVSTQCGIPQKPIGIFDTRIIYNKKKLKHQRNVFGMNSFLPNAVCLGDILKINNYQNTLIYSGEMSFHSMDIFFSSHGYDNIIDKKYFKNIDNVPKNSWSNGVNDSVLFNQALSEIEKYKRKNKNFNITILTTDTHFPGYIDPTCNHKQISNDELINSIHCTSSSVYNFVNSIYNKYGNSISIIVLGDHLYPIDDIYNNHKDTEAVKKNVDRSIYGRIISDKIILNRSKMTHYDFFPTILQTINLDYGDRLGLGFTILDTENYFDYDLYYTNLMNNISKESGFYYDFWK